MPVVSFALIKSYWVPHEIYPLVSCIDVTQQQLSRFCSTAFWCGAMLSTKSTNLQQWHLKECLIYHQSTSQWRTKQQRSKMGLKILGKHSVGTIGHSSIGRSMENKADHIHYPDSSRSFKLNFRKVIGTGTFKFDSNGWLMEPRWT